MTGRRNRVSNVSYFDIIITMTNLVSHTLFSEWLVFTLVWHVCLPLTNIGNNCPWDINLIPNSTSGKDVTIYATDTLSRGSGMVGHISLV